MRIFISKTKKFKSKKLLRAYFRTNNLHSIKLNVQLKNDVHFVYTNLKLKLSNVRAMALQNATLVNDCKVDRYLQTTGNMAYNFLLCIIYCASDL